MLLPAEPARPAGCCCVRAKGSPAVARQPSSGWPAAAGPGGRDHEPQPGRNTQGSRAWCWLGGKHLTWRSQSPWLVGG